MLRDVASFNSSQTAETGLILCIRKLMRIKKHAKIPANTYEQFPIPLLKGDPSRNKYFASDIAFLRLTPMLKQSAFIARQEHFITPKFRRAWHP